MKEKEIAENEIITVLRELRWRINKLEEMKNGLTMEKHSQAAEESFTTQSLSSQFFLTLHSSPAFQTGDDRDYDAGTENDTRLKRNSWMK